MATLLDRLAQRKFFRWILAYLAGAWLVYQLMDELGDPWGITQSFLLRAQIVLAFGLAFVVVLAWYHGEQGRQKVSAAESAILASLLVIAALVLVAFDPVRDAGPAQVERATAAVAPNSIVVLPFRDMSAGQDQEYMSEGVAEELLNLLAQIPELKVISRTTAFSLGRREGVTVPEIAAQLGVAHVLEGSVRTSGNTVRITAQLIDTRSDTQVFSDTYDGTLDDIFALQDSIAATVVSALRVRLLGALPRVTETDPEAYRVFLQARQISSYARPDSYDRVIAMFERVLEIDPNHAPTHMRLASIYHNQANTGARPHREGMQLAVQSVERALAIDSGLGEAHALIGFVRAELDLDLAEAAAHVQRGFELEPTHPEVLMMSAMFLGWLNRLEESITLLEYVAERDPLLATNLFQLAVAHLYSGHWEEAASVSREVLALSPGHLATGITLGLALLQMGDVEGARAAFDSEAAPPYRLFGLALVDFEEGRREAFEATIEQLGPVLPWTAAVGYAHARDTEKAFEWLERVTPQATLSPLVVAFPQFEYLHGDPRWDRFRERVGQSVDELAAIPFEVRPQER